MPTVLVVDDSAVDRRLVGGLLEHDRQFTVEYATGGCQALDRMSDRPPDVVLTDLLMPEMDGLELVRAVRIRHPAVPVILITAHGSEMLAVEALEQGAASYVPKSQLADKLLETVARVLGLTRADRGYERLMQCLEAAQFEFTFANDAELIDPLVDLVQQLVASLHMCDATGRVRLGVALEEALLNALYHGNLELGSEELGNASEQMLQGSALTVIDRRRVQTPYCDRRVHVRLRIAPDSAEFVVRDEGPGFDSRRWMKADPCGALADGEGRGLLLMRTFMDELYFNDSGNEVTMRKRRDPEANNDGAEASA